MDYISVELGLTSLIIEERRLYFLVVDPIEKKKNNLIRYYYYTGRSNVTRCYSSYTPSQRNEPY